MAQDRLIRAAVAAIVLAVGAVAEQATPATTNFLTAADFAVGALFAAAWVFARRANTLSLLTAAAWYLASLGAIGTLAYRAPLLQLLIAPAGPAAWMLTGVAWLALVLPFSVAGVVTATVAAIAAARAAATARTAGANRRPALIALTAATLATVWWLAALAVTNRSSLSALNDAAVVVAGGVALWARTPGPTRYAAGRLVIELGAAVTNDRPLTEQLARALGDPQLQLRYRVPNFGWVDEQGHPATEPSAPTGVVTRAAAPGGGEVALLHSRGDPRLAAAAAGAAALALDSARLEAEARARAAEMRASRHRLLSAADAERRSLEEQLSEGPLARLRRVDRLIAGSDAEPLRDELHAAMTELTALARGLYPPALTRADLAAALTDMAVRSAVPVTIAVAGDLRTISDDARATAWFVCSEALANVARHSGATHATVSLAIETNALAIEIADNGHGGAIPQRGLRGLADRIEAQGGALTLESPAGGPTVIRARI